MTQVKFEYFVLWYVLFRLRVLNPATKYDADKLFFFNFGHLKMFNICQIQPDLVRRIARKLTAKDLYNFCNMNLDCHRSVCHNNKFWKDKYEKVNRDDLSQPEDWDWSKLLV